MYAIQMKDYQAVFMPEGACARCDEKQPTIFETFQIVVYGEQPTELTTKLGFCGTTCLEAFVRGTVAVKSLKLEIVM